MYAGRGPHSQRTSRGLQKCGSFRDLEVLNHSCRLSKSGQIQKKNIAGKEAFQKKRHGHNNEFETLIRNQRVPNRGGYTLIQWQRSKFIIVALFFFVTPLIFGNGLKISQSSDFEEP